jgi:hypothetical protein
MARRAKKAVELRCCRKCDRTLELTSWNFGKNGSYWRTECRLCTRLTSAGRYESKRLAGKPNTPPMGTPCDICRKTDKKLVFDHCHETLVHRGWLCPGCNLGLGKLGDTLESLERAVSYLKRF